MIATLILTANNAPPGALEGHPATPGGASPSARTVQLVGTRYAGRQSLVRRTGMFDARPRAAAGAGRERCHEVEREGHSHSLSAQAAGGPLSGEQSSRPQGAGGRQRRGQSPGKAATSNALLCDSIKRIIECA